MVVSVRVSSVSHMFGGWWYKFFTFVFADGFLLESGSKFPGLFLTDPNNAVVWMVSTHPLISKSSSRCTNLWWKYWTHQLQLVSPSLSCSIVFQFSSKVLVLISLFAFLFVNFVVSRNGKVYFSVDSIIISLKTI